MESSSIKKRLTIRRSLIFYFSFLFSITSILFFLAPYLVTGDQYVSGFSSFAYFNDPTTYLHYSIVMLLFSFIFSICSFFPSILYPFLKDENHKKLSFAVVVFFALKLIAEIVYTILMNYNDTNIELSFGSFIAPVLSFIFLAIILTLKINLSEDERQLIKKKDQSE